MAGVPDQKDRLSTSPAFDDISNIDDIANIPALSNLIDLDPDLTTSSSEIDEPNKNKENRKNRKNSKNTDQSKTLTLIQKFYDVVDRYSHTTELRPALVSYAKNTGDPKDATLTVQTVYTWKEYGDKVTRYANYLQKHGYKNTAIHAFNSPEWFVAALGSMAAGCHFAGIYNTNTDFQCAHVIKTAECSVLVVDTYDTLIKHYSKVFEELYQLSVQILVIEYVKEDDRQILELLKSLPEERLTVFMKMWDHIQHFDTAISSVPNLRGEIDHNMSNIVSLIFTSGTTSDPKAVGLTNRNIMAAVDGVLQKIQLGGDASNPIHEVVLSYLPLSHVAGQCLDIFAHIYHGGEVHFAMPDALKGSLKTSLQIVRPTVFLGVPRVWEKIKEGILASASAKYKGVTGSLLKGVAASAKAVNYAYQKTSNSSNTSYVAALASFINYPAFYLSSSMTDVVRKQLGFDRCRYFVSGAAPISTEVLEYFMSLNMPIHEIYGMSETSGIITLSDPFSAIDKFCGEPVKGIDLVIDPKTDEILVRGPMVFGSYYNYTAKSGQTEFDTDNYFKTGDCGTLLDGKLKITGRLKELIITAGGENVPPILIESRIRSEICSNSNGVVTFEPQLMVVGDRQKYLTLVVFNGEEVQITDRMVELAVQSYNTSYAISNSQKIQKHIIIKEALTVESGLLTPTMKVKRAVVVKHYSDIIQKMYGADYAQT